MCDNENAYVDTLMRMMSRAPSNISPWTDITFTAVLSLTSGGGSHIAITVCATEWAPIDSGAREVKVFAHWSSAPAEPSDIYVHITQSTTVLSATRQSSMYRECRDEIFPQLDTYPIHNIHITIIILIIFGMNINCFTRMVSAPFDLWRNVKS